MINVALMAPGAMPAPSQSSKPQSTRAWDALTPPLAEWILDAVSSMGFQRMTPVQASTIPLFMAHKDVVVEVRKDFFQCCWEILRSCRPSQEVERRWHS